MIEKIQTGVDFFDASYGGVYKGRTMLVSGPRGTGKTVIGLQFIGAGLKNKERCLLLSACPAEDVALTATAFDIPVAEAIEAGDFIILEYKEYVPGRDREDELKLPKDSFLQLKHIIEDQEISRVVLDTVLPWVTLDDVGSLAEHIFSFVRVFQRMGVSTLFTLPRPTSPAAMQLRAMIEVVVPIAISLDPSDQEEQFFWTVNKYLGAPRKPRPFLYGIEPNIGIAQTMSATAPDADAVISTPKAKAGATASKGFANVLLSNNGERKPTDPQPALNEVGFRHVAKDVR